MARITRQDMLNEMNTAGPRARQTTIRLIEGDVADDGVAYTKETLNFLDNDGTTRSLEVLSTRLCSFGHVLDQRVNPAARATCCGAITCGTPGCCQNCIRCGVSLCRRHTQFVDGEPFCRRCVLWAALKLLVFGRKETKS